MKILMVVSTEQDQIAQNAFKRVFGWTKGVGIRLAYSLSTAYDVLIRESFGPEDIVVALEGVQASIGKQATEAELREFITTAKGLGCDSFLPETEELMLKCLQAHPKAPFQSK